MTIAMNDKTARLRALKSETEQENHRIDAWDSVPAPTAPPKGLQLNTFQAQALREDVFSALSFSDTDVATTQVSKEQLPNALLVSELPNLPHIVEAREMIGGNPVYAELLSHEFVEANAAGTFLEPEDLRRIKLYNENLTQLMVANDARLSARDLLRLVRKNPGNEQQEAELRATIRKMRQKQTLHDGIVKRMTTELYEEFDPGHYFQNVDDWFGSLLCTMGSLDEIQEAGWSPFGSCPTKVELKRKMEMAKKIQANKNLQKIIDRMGRMKNLASRVARERVKHGFDEIVDVTKGDHIPRVLPSEFIEALNPDTAPLFAARLADRQLMEYQMEGTEKRGRGGLFVLVDQSGSMYGNLDTWAKGLTGGLLRICQLQKRDLTVIAFAGKGQTKRYDFPKNQSVDIERIVTMLTEMLNGGTDYETPLLEAMASISTAKQQENMRPDILMITDGECDVSSTCLNFFNASRAAFQVHVNSYLLTTRGHSKNEGDILRKFSDKVVLMETDTFSDTDEIPELMFRDLFET